MALPYIIAVGNLVADPELRFTASGQALVKIRLACSDRRKNADTGKWEDGDTTFIAVSAWRQLAENTAESLTKGDRVVVTGRLKSRTVESAEGTKTTYYEIDADSIGADASNATVKISKTVRTSNTWGTSETSTATWENIAQPDNEVPF